MLTINPSLPRALSGETGAGTFAPPGSAADPAGFASLLRQSRIPVPAPAPAPPICVAPPSPSPSDGAPQAEPAPPSSADEASSESQAPQENDSVNRGRTLQKTRLRAADGTAVPQRSAKSGTAAADTAQNDAKAEAAADQRNGAVTPSTATGASVDNNLAAWLAALQRPVPADAADPHGGDIAPTVNDRPGAAAGAAADTVRDLRTADLATELNQQTALAATTVTDTAVASRFAALMVEAGGLDAGGADKAAVHSPVDSGNAARDAAAAASALAPTPFVTPAPAAPVAVAIATPVDAPDFAQALGMNLSLLAKDGVHTAELHLNPADMGPVSVQIVMDGTQARVDFGADVAATRHAIEAGLPELASALRDAGFTLAGGGVSQHAGGRSGGDGDRSGTDGNGERRTVATPQQQERVATAARRIVARGGVDLFA